MAESKDMSRETHTHIIELNSVHKNKEAFFSIQAYSPTFLPPVNRVEGMKFQLNDNPHAEEIPCTYHTHFHGRIQLQETGMVPHR